MRRLVNMGNSSCKRCCRCCQTKKEQPSINRKRVTSIHDYLSRTKSDLNLKKGDVLEVISETEYWLYVRRQTAKVDGSKHIVQELGYVPKDFVKPLDSVEAELWYFENVKMRIEARRCLLRPQNDEGAFLIWKCYENNNYYYYSEEWT